MVSVAVRRLGNLETAEDIVHDSIIKAIMSRKDLRETSSLRAWLRSIVTNACHNYYRKNKKEFVELDSVQLTAPEIAEYDVLAERKIQLKKEIERLPPKQKMAVYMRIYQGKSFKEIAEAMNAPYNTAKANYRHGLLVVRRRMRGEQ